MNYAEARAELEAMVSADVKPVLTTDEITMLLARCRVADADDNAIDAYVEWTAGTAYAVGDTVVPEPRNGHYYTCTVAGTSGASQPTWPTDDGDTVAESGLSRPTWEESGSAPWVWTWALNIGAAMGWGWKAGKVSKNFDIQAGKDGLKLSDVFKHCVEMKKLYSSGAAAAPRLPGRLATISTCEENEGEP